MYTPIRQYNDLEKEPSELDLRIEQLVAKQLDNGANKHISKIHDEIPIKYNSLNISVGKPGSSKTTFVMKTIMKFALFPNDFHMVIYITDKSTDDTVNSLLKYVKLPFVQCSYDEFKSIFEEFINLKEAYHKIRQDPAAYNEEDKQRVLEELYLKDFSRQNIQTLIFADDASFFFDKKSPFRRVFTQLRHYNCVFWLVIHCWRSIDTDIKRILSAVFISKGLSREELSYIHRQISSQYKFNDFAHMYESMKGKFTIMHCDCQSGNVNYVNNVA